MVEPVVLPSVTVEDIHAAAGRIRPHAVVTPLIRATKLESRLACHLRLKAENLQRVGAFKFRGAFNILASIREAGGKKNIVTSSSGNHGQAVAAAGAILDFRVTVVMPENAVQVKVDAVRSYGAAVEFAGTTSPERESRAQEIGSESGATVIGSFDDARIIAGQGTVGLEIVAAFPNVDAVIVPVGGGGLISGIAVAIKTLSRETRIIGVEPVGASDAYQSLQAGCRVTINSIDTIADGLRTSAPGVLNFEIMRRLVDEIVLVSDDDIRSAMKSLALDAKLVVEPSGAVAVAALLSDRLDLSDKNVVAVLSGGNVDPQVFANIITA